MPASLVMHPIACMILICVLPLAGVVTAAQPQDATDATESQIHAQDLRVITGEIIDGGGKPIVGARVSLLGQDALRSETQKLGATFSDKHGKFEFKDVPSLPTLVVAARATGRASMIKRVEAESFDVDVVVTLNNNPGTLSGVITDQRGQPIEGATVYKSRYLRQPIDGVWMDVTDEQGRYEIRDLTRWQPQQARAVTRTFFSIRHPDFADTRPSYAAIPSEVNVELRPPAVIRGQVINEVTGLPLSNVLVSAQGVEESHWHQTTTDAKGNYELRTETGHFNIWAEFEGVIPVAAKAIKAESDQQTLGADIRMVRGGWVIGTIPEFKAVPARDRAAVRVAHYGPARPATGAAVLSTTLDDDGSFRLHVAPGRNYLYLMNGAASTYVTVGDGEEVEIALSPGVHVGQAERAVDPDRLLAAKLRRDAMLRKRNEAMARIAKVKVAEAIQKGKAEGRIRRASATGRLLDKLEILNQTEVRFSDPWCNVIIEIVQLGPDAVPELIDELDATVDNMMLRSLGFILRAIDDKRAVPALIRSIPRTLMPPGSDMGLQSREKEIVDLFQKHDLQATDREGRFGFGRPVREIFGALQKLTGQSFGEQELYHIHKRGTPEQIHLKEKHYHRVAKKWSAWWEETGKESVVDKRFQVVDLAPLVQDEHADPPSPLGNYKTGSGGSNMMLSSVLTANADDVFYDLDTGRYAGLPQRLQGTKAEIKQRLPQIKSWAIEEGFDLIGNELEADGQNPACFVIEPLKLKLWELPEGKWKMRTMHVALPELKDEGRQTLRLLHRDVQAGRLDRESKASFLYVTAEGTPGLLFIGIEVRDDTLKPGGAFDGDNELNPVAFRKGRRFAVRELIELPDP